MAGLRPGARLFDTGHNRKTDAHDAHAVAVVAVRTGGLRVLSCDVELEALRMVVDHCEELTRRRVQSTTRLHRLLAELTPGMSKKDITAHAKAVLASVRPRDLAGKTRRRLAVEHLAELVAVEKKTKASTKELKAMVLARGSTPMELPGVGPVVAARILVDVGDVARFADRDRFAPVDRHRASGRILRRAGPPPSFPGREPDAEDGRDGRGRSGGRDHGAGTVRILRPLDG